MSQISIVIVCAFETRHSVSMAADRTRVTTSLIL